MLPTPVLIDRVHQWETAGAHLVESLAIYLDSCLKLTTRKVENASDAKHLVSRIDHTLKSLYVTLEQQLAQSRCTLARTRNKLVARFYSVPEEILAKIFSLVVYDRSDCEIQFIEDDIRGFYRQLHSLLAVCTVWRDIGISHGALWTLIPMMSRKSGWLAQSAAERSYGRAGGRELHLAASIENSVSAPFRQAMVGNFGRFRSKNLVFQNKLFLEQAMCPLFDTELPPNILDELSLYRFMKDSEEIGLNIPQEHEFLTSLHPSLQYSSSIHKTVQSVRVLRMKNIHVHWKLMALPKLVELRIESVMIGTKANFRGLLLALRAAPQLQKLKLISLNTNQALDQTPVPIPLPNLHELHLGNLYADDADMILHSITPASYRLSLHLTPKMAKVLQPEGNNRVGLGWLISVVKEMKVDTLSIEGDKFRGNWVVPDDFQVLLFRMPFVETFKLDSWEFRLSEWEALARPHSNITFAKLHTLQLTNTLLTLEGVESFKAFISGHPIQHLTLGGMVEALVSPNCVDTLPIKESDPLVKWLKSKVPNIRVVADGYIPPEFRTHHWELW